MSEGPSATRRRQRAVCPPCCTATVSAFLLLAAAVAGAQEQGGAAPGAFAPGELRVADLGPLQRIVVVEGGRTMPLDSYARFTLLRLSGRRSYDRRPAIEWLARVLFTPNETHDDDIFVVDNPEVIDAMGLPSRGRDRYSLSFLLPGLDELERLAEDAGAISEDNRTIVEREILRLWNNVGLYANLLSSFAFTYPHRDFQVDDAGVAELLGLPGTGTYSYLDIALRRAELREAATAAGLAHAAGGAFSRGDGLLLRLGQSLAAWQGNFVGLPLAVVPVGGVGRGVRWLTPWQALDGQWTAGLGTERRRALETELLALRDLQVAYIEGRDLRFGLAARQFNDSVQRRTAAELDIKNPELEILYNRSNPYLAARVAYGAGLLLLGLSFLGFRKWLYRASVVLLLVGLLPHTFGLVLRILITDRPPVTNLFETFVFVGWGAVVCGLVMEYLRKRYLGVFSGLAGGFVFFLLSGKFAAEDTMPVLQAVLDTNFWLSTHVTVITTGYMACCVAGLIGHVYMVQAILQGRRGERGGRDGKRLAHTYRTMFGTLALGLTFSFVGTMLGGIWADQSWGRFWGWDPKENGALLIVLWCAILFHARMGKMIGPFGMAAGSALLIIVVMMAWFGINLLGVGLHSYGFIDGVLLGLLAYGALQVGAVAALAACYRYQQRRGTPLPEPPSPGAGSAAAGTANGTAHAAEHASGGATGAAAAAAER